MPCESTASARAGKPQIRATGFFGRGGHIGLFMGSRTLRDHWPKVGRWIEQAGRL